MQRANVIVRLAGSLTNTVPKFGVTPAEILLLRRIHGGDDAVVDIRPTEFDKKIRVEAEYERLAQIYDGGSGFGSSPDEDRKSHMETMFPGAIKRLPMTLEEIGIDTGAIAPEPEPVPSLPDVVAEDDETEVEEPEAETAEEPEAESGNGAGGGVLGAFGRFLGGGAPGNTPGGAGTESGGA